MGTKVIAGGYIARRRSRPTAKHPQQEDRSMKDPKEERDQDDDDNRSRQLNDEHDAYWQSRGHGERPDDWESRREDK